MVYTCPYCNKNFDKVFVKTARFYESPTNSGQWDVLLDESRGIEEAVVLDFCKCPDCGEVSIRLQSFCKRKNFNFCFEYPPEKAGFMPDYVPEAIRQDYIEALLVLNQSPKASATLSRRCLQGMIRDYWGIRKSTLNEEMKALQSKVDSSVWNAIEGVRQAGNIGAHMEKDVNVMIGVSRDEAQTLIALVRLLVSEWYIARHNREQLLKSVSDIGVQKKNEHQLAEKSRVP